jgi:hypothetical protein
MTQCAHWLARHVWWFLLWFLRRPAIKLFRATAHQRLPKSMQAKAHRNVVEHDKFARKYGVQVLTIMFLILITSILLSLTGWVVLRMIDNGVIPTGNPKGTF